MQMNSEIYAVVMVFFWSVLIAAICALLKRRFGRAFFVAFILRAIVLVLIFTFHLRQVPVGFDIIALVVTFILTYVIAGKREDPKPHPTTQNKLSTEEKTEAKEPSHPKQVLRMVPTDTPSVSDPTPHPPEQKL